MFFLQQWAQTEHRKYWDNVGAPAQAALQARLMQELRTNTYNAATGDLTVSIQRAEAFADVGRHYDALFGNDATMDELREAYAMATNSVPDAARRQKLNAFFFWTAWACVTNRPHAAISYTNNWPSEALVGNRPSPSIIVWSVVSFVLLLAGIGALAWPTSCLTR